MSKIQITGADIGSAFGPWLLTEAALIDVDSQVHVR